MKLAGVSLCAGLRPFGVRTPLSVSPVVYPHRTGPMTVASILTNGRTSPIPPVGPYTPIGPAPSGAAKNVTNVRLPRSLRESETRASILRCYKVGCRDRYAWSGSARRFSHSDRRYPVTVTETDMRGRGLQARAPLSSGARENAPGCRDLPPASGSLNHYSNPKNLRHQETLRSGREDAVSRSGGASLADVPPGSSVTVSRPCGSSCGGSSSGTRWARV